MLPFVIAALTWMMATVIVIAVCQAAARNDAAVAKAPQKASEFYGVAAVSRRTPCGNGNAASARETEIGRLLGRAACRDRSVSALQRLQTGATRHLARGAVSLPSVKCPARSNRWGHVREFRRDRSPLAPQHTLTRAGSCKQARYER